MFKNYLVFERLQGALNILDETDILILQVLSDDFMKGGVTLFTSSDAQYTEIRIFNVR